MQMPGLHVNPVMLLQLYNKVVWIGGKKILVCGFSLVRPEPMTFQAPKTQETTRNGNVSGSQTYLYENGLSVVVM